MKRAAALRLRERPARGRAGRRPARTSAVLRLALLVPLLMLFFLTARLPAAPRAPVYVMTINGMIEPTVATYLDRVVTQAEKEDAAAVLIEMDTPGGLLSTTHDIVRRMLASKVPIVVYIAPSGARAGSAGTFITAAASVAAMAPGTNIGAAHPVDEGGNAVAEKITNDAAASIRTIAEKHGRDAEWYVASVRESVSITEKQALQKHVIDLVATDRQDLLRKLNGRSVAGHRLVTDGAPVVPAPMDARERFLHTITHPNIAYILMIIAVYGIIAELNHPGLILPGVAGVTAALLALYSFAVLPISAVGLVLMLLGIGLMIADVKVPSHGILTASGALAFGFGSFMLVRSPDPFLHVSVQLVVAATVVTTAFFALIVGAGLRAQRRRVVTGFEGLLGEPVVAKSDITPRGTVLAEGELWKAENVGEEPIPAGGRAVVVGVDGFTLKVRKEI